MRGLIYFIDIDGTLTAEDKANAAPIASRVAKVRDLIANGHEVVLWSARGSSYAGLFAFNNHIDAKCVGKPNVVIDDKPEIRKGGLIVMPPDELDK